MTFEEYLAGKRIDGSAFHSGEPELWVAWKQEFEQMSPNSFTSRRLYAINPLRRKYRLKEAQVKPAAASPAKPRPVIRPKLN